MFSLLLDWMQKNQILPQISDTERQALEAGDVWIDGEFFSGRPDFTRILDENYDKLPANEQAFLDGPVEELLRMCDAYKLSRERKVPDEVMQFLADKGFFAMQIDKEYGGMPFSTLGKSCMMAKITPVSGILSALVVIPNSLGAAELLGHYGTEEQKKYYLPKLASGEFVPCFGLTEPTAGSDAASMKADGEVFRDSDGEIQFRLNFRKRYITLAPISNLISLAVRLRDPDNLLGKGEDVGITVVLVEKGAEGLHIGDHHEPIGDAFPNGPIVGRDLVVPAKNVLGGVDYIGQGWKMLMESLAGGRMVSLPASGISAMRSAAAAMGAYSMVRQQFGIPIGKMDGVSAKVGHVASMSYMFEGARVFGCSALDAGIQPPVASAIMKAWSTEVARQCGIDAMDVMAGAAVMQGPRNIIGRGYCSAPVAITVEGANIMTRTLMVFGQGATRCHPYAYKVVQAVESNDKKAFRNNLLGWMWQFVSGFFMTLLRGITRGHFTVSVPDVAPETRHWYRQLGWAASRFGLLTNLAMFIISGKLKARGNLTGRYADAVAWMLLAMSALRRYEAEGRRKEDLPLLDYSCQYALHEVQQAFDGIYANFGGPVGAILNSLGRFWLAINPLAGVPSDKQSAAAAATMQHYGEQFKRLSEGLYLPEDDGSGTAILLHAFRLTSEAEPVRELIRNAQHQRVLPKGSADDLAEQAFEKKLIGERERDLLIAAREACLDAIEVDVFTADEFYGVNGPSSLTATGDGGQNNNSNQAEGVSKAS
mgnify:CR=1 FL=1